MLLLVPTTGQLSVPAFHVVHTRLIDGYQLYAVQKWIVERTRPVTLLAVFTGDPAHKIAVTALSPSPDLSPQDAQVQWDKAIHLLRKDGARPKETPHGTIMATSLAHFRSDYTIVHIPRGDFLAVREQLYTNINLLRMGCSGRSALTLEEPSDSTKDRFISMYHLPDSCTDSNHPLSPIASPKRNIKHSIDLSDPAPTKTKDLVVFNNCVLELVRLIQAALAVFAMFPAPFDGLLCDITVEGIQRWVADIGEPCLAVEPMERIADPAIVSALLSLVLAERNKLAALGYSHVTPKDPFLHPHALANALVHYTNSCASPPTATPQGLFHSPYFPVSVAHHPSHSSLSPPTLTLSSSIGSSVSASVVSVAGGPTAVLTRTLVDAIDAAYDKARRGDSRKVRRVLRSKLDDLTAAVKEPSDDELDPAADGGPILSGLGNKLRLGGGTVAGPAGVLEATMDLATFVRAVVGKEGRGGRIMGIGLARRGGEEEEGSPSGKERDRDGVGGVAGSVRGLWSGRVMSVVRLREREVQRVRERGGSVSASIGRKDKARRDRWALGVVSDGDIEEPERTDGRTTEEDSDLFGSARPWSGRVQKKIEAWAGLSRRKGLSNTSIDATSAKGGRFLDSSLTQSPTLHPVTYLGDGDEDELLSSGQVSPISDPKTPHPFHITSADSSALNLTANSVDYERRITEFNMKRPWGNRLYQSRISSWSDPVSARGLLDADDKETGDREHVEARATAGSILGEGEGDTAEESVGYWDDESAPAQRRRVLAQGGAKRRRSFHDLAAWRDMRVLTVERMKIDVELCGQLLVMSRRESHLANVVACLQVLTTSLAATNAVLREDYESNLQFFSEVEARTRVIGDVEAARVRADAATQETNTLLYESAQFRVRELWHTARPPRQKVLDLRDKVFGADGRRLPAGVHGAHGAFNRLQWTLDGRERLVDYLGRTPSEVEEESAVGLLEEAVEGGRGGGEEEDVVEHPGIKPMWLLRFFTSWGARWGGVKKQDDKKEGLGVQSDGRSSSVDVSSVEQRSPPLLVVSG